MDPTNILESSLNCCLKCKGLFKVSSEDNSKHLMSCSGNPFKSSTSYFACERNIFLQLFQPEDFQLDGSFNLQNISKDDSFLNQVVKIRLQQETFDPLLFLRNYTTTGPSVLPETSLDLLDDNITDLETEVNKDVSFDDNDKSTYAVTVEEDQFENIINKNIDYLKHDAITGLHHRSDKQSFSQSQNETELLSPLEKQLNFLTDESKLQSPFDKGTDFLPEANVGYRSDTLNYAAPRTVPFSCTLSTDLLGDLTVSQTVNPASLTSIDEPCQTLQHLDIEKKDPFLGQNPGLAQLNSKDPFLINATVRTEKPLISGQKFPSSAKSFFDMHTSPTFQLQDGNYFTFPSMLDEPTQLDYLDLATIDFLTNPNFTYGLKEKNLSEKDEFNSDMNTSVQDQTLSTLSFDSFDRFDKKMTLPTRTMDDSAVDRKMKRLRMKKVKTRIPKKSKSCMYIEKGHTSSKSTETSPRARRNSAKDTDKAIIKVGQSRHHLIGQSNEAPEKTSERTKSTSRKRKLSLPSTFEAKQAQVKGDIKPSVKSRLCQSGEIFNVKDRLAGFTEEEKLSFKAVIGKNTCVLVKKQKLMPYFKPPIIAKVNELMQLNQSSSGMINLNTNVFDMNINGAETFLNSDKGCENKSDLHIKCPTCNYNCKAIEELKEHDCQLFKDTSRKQIMFTCFDCEFTCESISLLADHVKSHKVIDDIDQNNQQIIEKTFGTDIHIEKEPNETVEVQNTIDTITACETSLDSIPCVTGNHSKVQLSLNEFYPTHCKDNLRTGELLQSCLLEKDTLSNIVLPETLSETSSDNILTEPDKTIFHVNDNLGIKTGSIVPSSDHLNALYIQHNLATDTANTILMRKDDATKEIENIQDDIINTDVSCNSVLKGFDETDKYSWEQMPASEELPINHRTEYITDKQLTCKTESCFNEVNEQPTSNAIELNDHHSGLEYEVQLNKLTTKLNQEACTSANLETNSSTSNNNVYNDNSVYTLVDNNGILVSDYNDEASLTDDEVQQTLTSDNLKTMNGCNEEYNLNVEAPSIHRTEVEIEETLPIMQAHKATLTDPELCDSTDFISSRTEFNIPEIDKPCEGETSLKDNSDKDLVDTNETHDKDLPIGMCDTEGNCADCYSREHAYSKPILTRTDRLGDKKDGKVKIKTAVKVDGSESTPTFKCEHCSFESEKKAVISRHNEKHHGEFWYCSVPECEFKTVYKRNLTLHTMKHEGVKRFLCDKCPYSTPDATCLTSHQKHNHACELRFKCTDCDFASIMRMEILRHYRNRHLQQKIYACNQCDYRTGYTYLLKFHLMSHAGIKPFKCSLCDYQVCNGTKVMRHIKTVHIGQEEAKCIKLDLTFEIDAKQFKCAEPVNEKDIKVIELTDEQVKLFAEKKRKELQLKKETNERKEREKLKKWNSKKSSQAKSVKMVSLLDDIELIRK